MAASAAIFVLTTSLKYDMIYSLIDEVMNAFLY